MSQSVNMLNINSEAYIYGSGIDSTEILGTIIFQGYNYYTEFINFIRNKPLILMYILEDNIFKIDVEIASITKTEKTSSGWLYCDVRLPKLSLWYKKVEIKTVDIPSADNKIYEYKYPYKYIENTATKIILDNNGDVETPLYVEIFGAVQDPAYFIKQNDNLIGNCKINCDIPIGNKLVINSSFSSPEIAEYTISNDYVQNIYTSSDLNTTRFIRLPKGQSVFSFTSKNATYPQIQLSYKEYYATV